MNEIEQKFFNDHKKHILEKYEPMTMALKGLLKKQDHGLLELLVCLAHTKGEAEGRNALIEECKDFNKAKGEL